jgi:hypothetical protein
VRPRRAPLAAVESEDVEGILALLRFARNAFGEGTVDSGYPQR